MNEQPESKEPNNKGAFVILWLLVGLLPILILLTMVGSSASRQMGPVIIIFCALCNLVGGIGCFSSMKDAGLRIFLGLLLGGFFFMLSWGAVLFQACSHMNI